MPACSFCRKEIPVGEGVIFYRKDGTGLRFCSRKCEKNHAMGRNPKKLKWTGRK
jgi:large subunit ribosomal protein L24e